MGKTHRGVIYKEEGGRRGTCPVTQKTGVKLPYEQEIDGKTVLISKIGRATLRNEQRRKKKAAEK